MLLEIDNLQARDELLGQDVTQEHMIEAEEYLYFIASEFGLSREDIAATYHVKQFIEAFVFRDICRMKAFGAPAMWDANGNAIKDSYAEKYKFYQSMLETLEKQLTVANLTGVATKSEGFRAVSIYRG